MWFWIIAALLTLLVVSLFARSLLRGRGESAAAGSYDLQVYRDQLNDVERDLARGVISDGEAGRIKTEISRRILDADKAAQVEGNSHTAPKAAAIAAILGSAVVLGASIALYRQIGAPGYPDLPLQVRIEAANDARLSRPGQSSAEVQTPFVPLNANPQHLELVEKLRAAVATRPDDLQGHELLARNEAALGSYIQAYRAQIRVIELKGADAVADDFSALADLMIMAAGGYISPEAESSLQQALERDAQNGTARYYSGLMFAQTGRPDLAFRLWRDLLEESPPNAPWVAPIRAQIIDASIYAGVQYTLPPLETTPLNGPSADDIQAAGEMTGAERKEMIGSMVVRLSERLATEGGTPQEWARLIGALGVLGDTTRASNIWIEAQQVFAGNEAALAPIRTAAKSAGVAP